MIAQSDAVGTIERQLGLNNPPPVNCLDPARMQPGEKTPAPARERPLTLAPPPKSARPSNLQAGRDPGPIEEWAVGVALNLLRPQLSGPMLEAGAVVSNRPRGSEQIPSHHDDLDWLPTTLSTAVNACLDLSHASVLPVGSRWFEPLR